MSDLSSPPIRPTPTPSRRSLEIAAERGGDLTPRVYERLFAREPAMRALFWRDGNGAIKGEMLARVFEAILDFIGARAATPTT